MRKEKQLLLDAIKDKIDTSSAFIMASYEKLTANMATDFRANIDEKGGEFEVVPKRVFAKACHASDIDINADNLKGHIGVLFAGDDPIESTKTMMEFSKDNGKVFDLVGGYIDNILYSAEDVEKLSKLPGKDEMRSQLLGVLSAPMAQTVSVMNTLLTSVPVCLEKKAEKSE
ncbi:MAG: 50S ribosomal protein L10 [Chlamydiota bacterium]